MQNLLRVLPIVFSLLLMSGCAAKHKISPEKISDQKIALNEDSDNWAKNGSIVIARIVPLPKEVSLPTLLGFLPQPQKDRFWLRIVRKSMHAELMNGNEVIRKIPVGPEVAKLASGQYKIVLKQKNPLWYASDAYFYKRFMRIPKAGSKERYLRGALGRSALFTDKGTALHSGTFYNEDVGGVRMKEPDLDNLFEVLKVESFVEVV